jgi:hypothetical protein
MEARLMQVPSDCELAWYIEKDGYESLQFETDLEGFEIVDEMFTKKIIDEKEKLNLTELISKTELSKRNAVVYTQRRGVLKLPFQEKFIWN